MTKFRYIQKMHRELRRATPDGWNVQTIRVGRRVLTAVSCDDRGYYAPWMIADIVAPFGFNTVYA